jgi:hypothetical protein
MFWSDRVEVFHKKEDFAAFLDLMEEVGERLPMRLLAGVPLLACPAVPVCLL